MEKCSRMRVPSTAIYRNGTFPRSQHMSSWYVSNVTNMSRMFNQATSFNQDISKWNVSNVTDYEDQMFAGATVFNSDISKWNVSNVTNMTGMFSKQVPSTKISRDGRYPR